MRYITNDLRGVEKLNQLLEIIVTTQTRCSTSLRRFASCLLVAPGDLGAPIIAQAMSGRGRFPAVCWACSILTAGRDGTTNHCWNEQECYLSLYRGKGVPVLEGHGKGDLFVEVRIPTPKHLSKRQRDLLEELNTTLRVENKPQPRTLLGKVKDIFG